MTTPKQADAIWITLSIFRDAYESWLDDLSSADLLAASGIPLSGDSLYQEITWFAMLSKSKQPKRKAVA